jgi:hypothetical protein
MQFVLVFGTNYYFDNAAVPKFIQHRISYLVNRFGNNLDATAPKWAQHNAANLLTRFGLLNVA